MKLSLFVGLFVVVLVCMVEESSAHSANRGVGRLKGKRSVQEKRMAEEETMEEFYDNMGDDILIS